MLAMAENFRQQYVLLYPDHKALLLCPVNECGVQVHTANTLSRHGNITTNALNTQFFPLHFLIPMYINRNLWAPLCEAPCCCILSCTTGRDVPVLWLIISRWSFWIHRLNLCESDLTYDGCFCILDSKTCFYFISVLSSPSSCHLPPGFCRLREERVLISPSCCVACCWARDTTLTASVATLQKRCVLLISHDKSVLYCSLKYK